jgi:hypothetical protein
MMVILMGLLFVRISLRRYCCSVHLLVLRIGWSTRRESFESRLENGGLENDSVQLKDYM